MDSHFVGKRSFGQGDPAPTEGTSISVRLFMELVRGNVAVHVPANEFVTLAVEAEERYCPRCYVDGVWDVWFGRHDNLDFKLGRCRCCGKEKTL